MTSSSVDRVHGRSGRAPRLVLAAALSMAVVVATLAMAAPARAADSSPPQVTAFNVSPRTVDTGSSDQTVTVTVTLTDQTAVSSASVQLGRLDQSLVAPLRLVSGDFNEGVYQATLTMPHGSASGVWRAWLSVQDNLFNQENVTAAALDAAFGAGSAEVTNTATFADMADPQLTAFSVSPKNVNTDDAAQVVTATATVTDDWAGVATVQFMLGPASGSQYAVRLTRVSGDALDGTYSGTVTLPKGSQGGIWEAEFGLFDGLGNSVWRIAQDLDAQFGAGSAEVVNTTSTYDPAPPQVTALSITPSVVDTELSVQDLSVTATLTDDYSGVATANVTLFPLIGTQFATAFRLTRVSGTAMNGVYAGTIRMPNGSKEGMWTAVLDMEDELGNSASLDADQLHAILPGAVGLLVVNTATAEQVTIDRDWTIHSGSSAVTFPAGTVVTRQGGGRFAFYEMAAQPLTIGGGVPTDGLSGTPVAALELGIPGLGLSFSRPVTVSLAVDHAYDGYNVSIQSLGDGQSTWANEATGMVINGHVQFTVSHATKFAASLTLPAASRPVITRLSSTSGRRGATITLTGKSFGSRRAAGYVKFGAVKVTKYVSWSATRIKCRVPARAKYGRVKVVVVTAGGTSRARTFTVKR